MWYWKIGKCISSNDANENDVDSVYRIADFTTCPDPIPVFPRFIGALEANNSKTTCQSGGDPAQNLKK